MCGEWGNLGCGAVTASLFKCILTQSGGLTRMGGRLLEAAARRERSGGDRVSARPTRATLRGAYERVAARHTGLSNPSIAKYPYDQPVTLTLKAASGRLPPAHGHRRPPLAKRRLARLSLYLLGMFRLASQGSQVFRRASRSALVGSLAAYGPSGRLRTISRSIFTASGAWLRNLHLGRAN